MHEKRKSTKETPQRTNTKEEPVRRKTISRKQTINEENKLHEGNCKKRAMRKLTVGKHVKEEKEPARTPKFMIKKTERRNCKKETQNDKVEKHTQ